MEHKFSKIPNLQEDLNIVFIMIVNITKRSFICPSSDFQLFECRWLGSLCSCLQKLESTDSGKHSLEQGIKTSMCTLSRKAEFPCLTETFSLFCLGWLFSSKTQVRNVQFHGEWFYPSTASSRSSLSSVIVLVIVVLRRTSGDIDDHWLTFQQSDRQSLASGLSSLCIAGQFMVLNVAVYWSDWSINIC